MNNKEKFLVESILDDVANYLITDTGMPIIEALDTIYHSQFYDKLYDLGTGLYYQSPAYNYEVLKNELKYGKVA